MSWPPQVFVDNCEEPRLGLNHLNDGTDRRRVSLQDEDHPGNDPHLVPAFAEFVFPNVPGTVPERVCTCGLKRNSSNLYRAPIKWDSVMLNS